ncbi:MAG: Uma2 family endonuclease [Acidobacteriia bacterium]|nr:Uma2 family endonuclease [Terriglobia bacterium]
MTKIVSPPEQRVALRTLSWETYERLLSEHGDGSSPRFTFDRGVLEIMSPSAEHERYNLMIADLIGVLADEMDVEMLGLGATTFKRQDLECGFEADSCFYVQNFERVRNKERIDLATEPAPDLVIEIEITNPSINKLALFAEFGVPEVWRYDGFRLEMFQLLSGRCGAREESAAFPGVSATVLTQLLQQGKALGRTGWLRMTRAWAHEHYGGRGGPLFT